MFSVENCSYIQITIIKQLICIPKNCCKQQVSIWLVSAYLLKGALVRKLYLWPEFCVT